MTKLEKFYRSKEWERLRIVLMDERADKDGTIFCAACGKPIVRRYDCIAHHKTELTEENVDDVSIALNPENIELICFRCHNKEHQRFDGFCQKVYLVHGSPCAGKSTFVRENANADDLVLDLDRIWEAVCYSDRLHKPKRLNANVFGIRDLLIDQIRMRKGMWRNAWVIGTYPLESDRDRLCELLGAEPIHIDTDKETCLARAESEEWKTFIGDYFDMFVACRGNP